MLDSFVRIAKAKGASDLHLESGLPPILRIDGELVSFGEPISAERILTIGRSLIGEVDWPLFVEKGSFDLSISICNARCRINILKTLRGIGLAVRVLSALQPTLEKLNLHPDLMEILRHSHGLVLVSGPTGSGKSSTLAALIQEINLRKAKHIITLENPIEYHFSLQRAFIRQREVGRDTPSFSQGLIDAMREDPDVLMVGEMREAEVMRQTLNAAETGHLVFSTVHSGSVIEALQRVVAAFPAEYQYGVRAQLADTLLAVICQRLAFVPRLNIRVPECEILFCNMTAKAVIREGKFFKLNDIIQTGAEEKMWSFERYRKWMDQRADWYVAASPDPPVLNETVSTQAGMDAFRRAAVLQPQSRQVGPASSLPPLNPQKRRSSPAPAVKRKRVADGSEYYEIGDADSGNMEEILKALHTIKKPKS